ncbi:GntR family transcriptional regulator [Vibrio sp.]|uniref:GntR family transcriptional regulator n=1 Tax=Vibrio viridaestus TaxID=2487322 RepID=A0A3N9TL13_9VIBR|nr:FCD domain-containing protein [Vibrio viridaestus]MDC0612026.1 GntR family transcriptional regulator [Vibrio sp.]RQW64967.1 GntR family transcriptional regulator [Vibrio viridaestus]
MDVGDKLYHKIANNFKNDIQEGKYRVGDMLPAERVISEQLSVSRTVVREAMIMLEVEGYVEVRKGSGIRVINQFGIANSSQNELDAANSFMLNCGPFELLQARQLIESNIAEFAAIQCTKQDLVALMKIQEQAKADDHARDSHWDKEFHLQIARCTQNSAIVHVAQLLWEQRENNPYWKKMHEHILDSEIRSWCDEHDEILKALMQKDPKAAKQAMWRHLENTKEMLFNATNDDYDRFLYAESPIFDMQ